MLWFLVTGNRAVEATIAHCEPRPRLRPYPILIQQFAIDRTSIACLLVCSAVFGFWTIELTHSLSPMAAAFFLLAPLSIYLLGRRTLRWLDVPVGSGNPFPLEFLTGSFVAGFFLFFIDFVSPLPMYWNCIALLIISVLIQLVPSRGMAAARSRQGTLYAVLAVVVGLAAATFWTRDLRPYAFQPRSDVVFRPVSDFFVHAQMVGQLRADHNLLQLGNPDLAGLPLPIYHYGSYIYPACVSACTGQTAYDSLASCWAPFGVLLTGLAAYALGSTWWSGRAGLAALLGLLLIPDASTYGIHDAYYSYHWLVVANPGLLYGIAAGGLALLLVTRGIRPTNWRCLGAGFGLVLMCISLKAHLFVVVCPLLVMWLVLFTDGLTARQRLFLSLGLVTVGLAALMLADRYSIGPTILPFGQHQSLAAYFHGLAAQLSDPIHDVMRVIMASLGAAALVFPVLALFCYYRKELQPVDAVPGLAMLIFLACAILLPFNSGRGTPDELRHRTFAWAYFVFAVWTWGKAISILDTFDVRARWQACCSAMLVVASFAMLAWPWTRGATGQDPRLWWGPNYTNIPVVSGLVECAAFLREHAAEEEIVQEVITLDRPVLGALAERRCYLARCPIFWKIHAPNAVLHEESLKRAELIRRIGASTSRIELDDLANQTGIRWYVAHADEKLGWPDEILTHPAFQAAGYRVYDLKAK
jgi:hypothetical protein